jgi:hypothetical protein
MKKTFLLVMSLLASALWAIDLPKVGTIDYIEGGVSISRSGKTIAFPNIDDPILSGDLIKTVSDGLVIIALDRNTGMKGTITVRPRSSLYLKLDSYRGESRTTIDVLTGSIGSKVSKLMGSPSMNVSTSGTVMGVRGTEFDVAVSVIEAVLVACMEGKVACSDEGGEVAVPAGKVVEKRPGERFAFIPVAVSSLRDFRQRWIAEEIEAFKADAPRAMADYAERYTKLKEAFDEAYEPFQKSPVLLKWLDEDKRGLRPNPMDPAVMREKKEMVAYLLQLRKVLFLFERTYYRVDELSDILSGGPYERTEIKKGLAIGDFLRRVKDERDQLARQVARIRYAELLYAQRDPDGEYFGSEDLDFFDSDF